MSNIQQLQQEYEQAVTDLDASLDASKAVMHRVYGQVWDVQTMNQLEIQLQETARLAHRVAWVHAGLTTLRRMHHAG